LRRIVAILFIVFIGFWVVYGLFPPAKATVDGFVISTVGPVAFNFAYTMYMFVVDTVGFAGFAAITLGFGFIVGIVSMVLWRKADLGLTRKLLSRRGKELGTIGTTTVSTTPIGATTRPPTQQTTQQPIETKPLPVEEKKEEGETT